MAKTTKVTDKDLGPLTRGDAKEPKKFVIEDKVVDVLDDYQAAWNYVSNSYHGLWDDCWAIYNNQRVKVGYESVSDYFVPITFSTVESILANVAGGKPKFMFMPTRPDQAKDTKVINALMDYYWDCNDMSLKVIPWIRDCILYGTGVLYVSWGANDKPDIKNIPLKDFFIDPTATRIENAAFAGYRYLTTKKDLQKAKVLDPETSEYVPMYKNLEDLEDTEPSHGEMTDKESKDLFMGSTLGKSAKKKQVECIYYVTPERLMVVANRRVLIRDEANPYYRKAEEGFPEVKGFLPFAVQRNYIDTSLFYAKGDVEVILDAQEMLNDTSNQKIDNISYVLNNMWALDPAYGHLKEQIESVPGGVITAPKGAIEPIDKPVVTGEADREILRIKEEIREATGADEVIKGVKADQRTTATEINAQISQAGQRFAMKLATLENEGFKQLATILFKMAQLFVTQEEAVRIVGPTGVEWETYDPTLYQGEYEPKVQLDATAKAEKEKRAAQYQNLYQVLLQNPMINQEELLKLLMEKVFDLDDDEASRLLVVPQIPAGPGMEGLIGPGGPQPGPVEEFSGEALAPVGPLPPQNLV